MKKMINVLLAASMLASFTAVPLAANAAESQTVTVQTAETEEKPIISEKLKQDIDAGLEKIDVMMWCTFKIDYSKIHPEVNKATEEYKNTLDTSVYSADEINEMVGAFKNNLSDKMYQEAYAVKTKEVCDFIGIDVSEANFTGTALRCSLTPEQIYKIAGTDLVKGRVIEQCEYVSADDLGYNVVENIDNKAEDAKKAMEILNAYFKENNMDAKCVTSEEYPSYYPPLVIEYVAETVTGKQIMEFVEKNNIDNSLFEVVPIINGQKVYWVYDNVNIKGDANCDGSVDMADAVMIMQALANPNKYGIDGTADHHLTEQGKLNGDMDGDGLTVGDAQAIQRKLLGLENVEAQSVESFLTANAGFLNEKGTYTLFFIRNGNYYSRAGGSADTHDEGTWTISGDTVVLTGKFGTNRLSFDDNALIYIAEGSDGFNDFNPKDGEKFNAVFE